MFRLITLDAFNTLFKVRGSVGELYSKTAREHGLCIDAEILNEEYKKVYKKCYSKYTNFGAQNKLGTRRFWYNIVQGTFINSGYEGDESLIGRIASSLYEDFSLAKNWELFQDVCPVLKQLKNTGYNLGVVSNFDERLPIILERLDILQHFSFVLPSTVVKVAKPSPKIFHLALEKGEVDAHLALHVGDSVRMDYDAARSVGMKAYLIDRFSGEDKTRTDSAINPDDVITNLEPLLLL